MIHSPGGTTLPDKCHTFHPTFNNPYAVRCIDAWDFYDTGFPGDEYCILPPPPELGIQVGYHPQEQAYFAQVSKGDMSGYKTAVGSKFMLEAGNEETDNYRALNTTGADLNYYRIYTRMRTGSHHSIITLHNDKTRGGWVSTCPDSVSSVACDTPGFIQPDFNSVLSGQQRPDDNIPVSLDKPVEDAGLYHVLPKDPTVLFNLHHFNTTDKDMLKESWINIWHETDATKRSYWWAGIDPVAVIPGSYFTARPGDIKDFHYRWPISRDNRFIEMLGHRHLWTTNFTAWIQRQGDPKQIEVVYQSYDWLDMPTYRYDSVVMNPPLNSQGRMDGAHSGPIDLKAGDELHYNCHLEFTNERGAASGLENIPTVEEIGRINFANEIYSGEMCVMFGTSTISNVELGLPIRSLEPPPDFAR